MNEERRYVFLSRGKIRTTLFNENRKNNTLIYIKFGKITILMSIFAR